MTATETSSQLDQLCVDTIRTLAMDAVQKANSGHPGAPMGLAPVAYTLYARVMRHNPKDPDWIDRDRFILSAGHASMLLYASLFLSGYPMTLEDIEHFRQLGWPTAGHPERKDSPGIEATTGPLGQGLSMSVGLALAERMLAARVNRPGHEIVDHHTFVIASDGDMQEGVASEASSLAGHLGLGRLIVFYDDNKVQLAGPTSLAFSEDVGQRYEAYGWHVDNIGHDLSIDRIETAAREAMEVTDRPSLVVVQSHIGFGSPNKQDSYKAHGSPLGEDEIRLTKEAYGWDPDKHFYVPDEALAHFREGTIGRGGELQAEWEERFAAFKADFPEQAALLQLIDAGAMPEGWDADVPRFDPSEKPIATRAASGKTIQWAAKAVPQLIGGSADLSTSNNTDIDGGGDVLPHEYAGRILHFGVREHGMGAALNGLTLHGFRAFGGTFLTFSDYMKGAIRLAALMKLPTIFVYTHDSIGLGEDGPTHQPIEQLAALRAVPRLNVVRPADANETALGWRFALRELQAPTAFALSRQNLPILDPAAIPDDAIERGAYVLKDADGGDPELILIGTGSEVSLCLDAAKALEGVRVRVVSMPCMDTFTHADEAYRESVLPASCRARIAVEAASPLGWDKWIGEDGCFVGMETFGESGPADQVYKHFDITAEHVAEVGRSLLER
ncbi:MAG TPA: transketolase [Solirubrobacteraceae bacterium]|jgi:transketolase|nr:transketolase [Solirubrobacteraceae bacterium]